MRVALYNQMFGLNGKSLFSSLYGHWIVHFQSREKKIWERTNLEETIEIIDKSSADVIGVDEILEGQEDELRVKLNDLGYKHIFFGKGHLTEFRKLYIQVAVASKIKCKKVEMSNFPIENKMGGGGGFINCYFSELGLNLINVHLACVKKDVYSEQLKFLQNCLRELDTKIILLGDFNSSYKDIKDFFRDLELVSDEIKTCSITPGLKLFSYRDIDHIFIRGLKKKNVGTLDGRSDHKLIYVDLE